MHPKQQYSPDQLYSVKGEWVRHELIRFVPDDARAVLSLGCGSCATERVLAERGVEVWGLDVVGGALDLAKSRISKVLLGDIEQDPLNEIPNDYFDAIILGDVLEHLRFPHIALRRAHEWLKEDGRLIASVPNFSHYSVIRSLFLQRTFEYKDGGIFDRGHYRIFTRKNLSELVAGEGYKIENTAFLRPLDERRPVLTAPIRAAIRVFPFINDYFAQTWIVQGIKTAAHEGRALMDRKPVAAAPAGHG